VRHTFPEDLDGDVIPGIRRNRDSLLLSEAILAEFCKIGFLIALMRTTAQVIRVHCSSTEQTECRFASWAFHQITSASAPESITAIWTLMNFVGNFALGLFDGKRL
jgi:hypothetical protein